MKRLTNFTNLFPFNELTIDKSSEYNCEQMNYLTINIMLRWMNNPLSKQAGEDMAKWAVNAMMYKWSSYIKT